MASIFAPWVSNSTYSNLKIIIILLSISSFPSGWGSQERHRCCCRGNTFHTSPAPGKGFPVAKKDICKWLWGERDKGEAEKLFCVSIVSKTSQNPPPSIFNLQLQIRVLQTKTWAKQVFISSAHYSMHGIFGKLHSIENVLQGSECSTLMAWHFYSHHFATDFQTLFSTLSVCGSC